MSQERWVPPTPQGDLFTRPEFTKSSTEGVWLGLGDVIHIAPAAPAGNSGEAPLVWQDHVSLVFAAPYSYDSRAVHVSGIGELRKDNDQEEIWGVVEMPKPSPAAAIRIVGTLMLSEVQELVVAHWPRHGGLDAVSLLCPDGAVRTPRWYSVLTDLSLVQDPAQYLQR